MTAMNEYTSKIVALVEDIEVSICFNGQSCKDDG